MSWTLGATLLMMVAATEPQPYAGHFTLDYRGPLTYADRATETLFYVESDGRHISAIRFDGKVVWTRDPYADAELDRAPYRVKDRKIVSIGRAEPARLPKGFDRRKVYLSIAFNSTDFGVVDASNGNFTYFGRD